MKRYLIFFCVVLLATASLYGCASQESATTEAYPQTERFSLSPDTPDYEAGGEYYEDDYDYPAEDEGALDALTGGSDGGMDIQPVSAASRKIVYTVNLSLQTLNFEDTVADVESRVLSIDGYLENSYIEGQDINASASSRYAHFTARIPADRLNSFVAELESEFHVASKEQSAEDITEHYYDTDSRLRTLQIQEERLLEMLEQAEELEYLIDIERELANVRYQIESLTSSLGRLDGNVSMSTVYITVQERRELTEEPITPNSFGEEIGQTVAGSWGVFLSFLKQLVLVVIALIPFLIFLAAIGAVIYLFVRLYRKKHPKQPRPVPVPMAANPPQVPYGPLPAPYQQAPGPKEPPQNPEQ